MPPQVFEALVSMEDLLTCVKVLVCIVEAWMCSTTRSTSGLGPVTKPILSLVHNHTHTQANSKDVNALLVQLCMKWE